MQHLLTSELPPSEIETDHFHVAVDVSRACPLEKVAPLLGTLGASKESSSAVLVCFAHSAQRGACATGTSNSVAVVVVVTAVIVVVVVVVVVVAAARNIS